MTADGRHVIAIVPPTKAWQRALPRAAALVRAAALAGLRDGMKHAPAGKPLRAHQRFEISVMLCGNATVQRLNRTYRGKDKPTNVLSFPADAPTGAPAGAPLMLGDVVVAYGVAAAESRREGKTLAAHLSHLVLHGVLHLLGYDHGRPKDATVMERLETQIMAGLGFADPYAAPAKRPHRRPRRAAKSRRP
jgi:probable rRNA maturation factor